MKINWKLVLVHLLLWMAYVVIWGLMDLLYAPTFWDTLDGNFIGCLCYCIGVYLNLYFLIPHFLLKKRKLLYVLLLMALVMFNSFFAAQVFSFYYTFDHLPTSQFFASIQGLGSTTSEFLILLGFSMCFHFINEWYVKERRLRELQSVNLRAELDLLKGQINPHFLFNALNSIHVLIRKDQDKALSVLERFSDLLSHQIYDAEKEFVTLESEIKNLSNFIELQRMRFANHVQVEWKVTGKTTGLKIAPMLFLNFVENAFKHGKADGNTDCKIEILLSVDNQVLEFSCVNSASTAEGEGSGKGIANAKRRLELLYPQRHTLQIERAHGQFSVNLQIQLNEN